MEREEAEAVEVVDEAKGAPRPMPMYVPTSEPPAPKHAVPWWLVLLLVVLGVALGAALVAAFVFFRVAGG